MWLTLNYPQLAYLLLKFTSVISVGEEQKKKVCMSSHVLNFTENISEELCGPLKNSAMAHRLKTSVLN